MLQGWGWATWGPEQLRTIDNRYTLESFLNMAGFKSALLITPFSLPLLASPKCQLIVCQMSSTRCPTLNWLLLPLFLVVAAVNVGAVASHLESLLLYALTAAFTLAHIHYGVQVVSSLERGRPLSSAS